MTLESARTGRLLAGGQRLRGKNLLGRLQAAHERSESVPIAECAQRSARTGRLLAGGQLPRGKNLLGRLQAAHERSESVPIAECAQNSRIPPAEQRRQRFAMPVVRRESAAEGPNRVPIGTSCRLRCWASAQVRHAAQAETLGDFSESLPAGCEEMTQQTALAQFFQPCLPGFGRRPNSLEDGGDFTRDRGFAVAEQPPGVMINIGAGRQKRFFIEDGDALEASLKKTLPGPFPRGSQVVRVVPSGISSEQERPPDATGEAVVPACD